MGEVSYFDQCFMYYYDNNIMALTPWSKPVSPAPPMVQRWCAGDWSATAEEERSNCSYGS